MIDVKPVVLERHNVRLEPMAADHAASIEAAAADGKLWELWYTATPPQGKGDAYVEHALKGQAAGHMLPFVVRDLRSGDIVGSTRYHDIVPAIDRVEIGYTFYAKRCQRTHINTVCKLLLLEHAFDALGCKVVGWRTDGFNFTSQRAIEALGAKKDGVLRHHQARRDGSPRDTVMYSMLLHEWRDARRHLEYRLHKHGMLS